MPNVCSPSEGRYSYYLDFDKNICVMTGFGNVDFSVTKKAMSAVKKDASFGHNMQILVDLRNITFYPTYDELISLKDHLVFLKENHNSSIALVISDELYYIGLLITKLTQAVGLSMCVFKKMEKAESWLCSKSVEIVIR